MPGPIFLWGVWDAKQKKRKKEKKKKDGKKEEQKERGEAEKKKPPMPLRGMGGWCLTCDFGIGVCNVAWEGAVGECLAGGVSPGAVDVIICVDEFEADASGEGGKPGTSSEHVSHIRYLRSIKRRQI